VPGGISPVLILNSL